MPQDTWHWPIYGSQDTEDVSDTQDVKPLDVMPQDHHVPEGDKIHQMNIVKKLTLPTP